MLFCSIDDLSTGSDPSLALGVPPFSFSATSSVVEAAALCTDTDVLEYCVFTTDVINVRKNIFKTSKRRFYEIKIIK